MKPFALMLAKDCLPMIGSTLKPAFVKAAIRRWLLRNMIGTFREGLRPRLLVLQVGDRFFDRLSVVAWKVVNARIAGVT